ncbi:MULTISPECIES: TetR/AcrR family transcriptional regulator [unclassified Pseudoalteromonas]|uniref:TetR/AcrR family transcriptional regulator n=1 Tax=unclassified Pseudoalteromonas TaxID=194690 RepID=UPI00110A8792|nr:MULTISPECIES: TetR/AcrR family transcriptional regulator [unclassified Pseudoalteromonas]TMP45545.1 TetR/AcrR family transcriptional regulator [Pseudoalteromonas sp. S1650]TMP68095.1 TetR/AcrR family transcriptional regulator [Pseudoalteromonas sp. S1649]
MKKNAKTDLIIDTALHILRHEGDYGVTMRKVANEAGMTLSNVQYYFKNKDELLKAMADRYFKSCLDDMRQMDPISNLENPSNEFHSLLESFLSHGLKLTQMCRIFREYWAISTRNEVINQHIKFYYEEMALILADKLRPISHSDSNVSRAVSIFIPFVEGYSITAQAMPERIDSISKIMTEVILNLLTDEHE